MSLKNADSETKRRISSLGAKAKHEKFLKRRELRLCTAEFNVLNKKEKRIRIFREQSGCCCICKNHKWNDLQIPLELDHINGNRLNESRENLRLICPNCHAQTETYKVGNNKGKGKKYYSDKEIIEALFRNNSGYTAMKSIGMNPHGGNYVRIRKIIKEHNLQLSYTV